MSNEQTNLSVALNLAQQQGWAVFPVFELGADGKCSCGNDDCSNPGKHPRISGGFKNASKDSALIRNWWRQNPRANIGVATGRVSGFFAIDIDPRHGGNESWTVLLEQNELLPNTVESITGSNGRHFLFKCPTKPVKNSANLRPGVDVRGDGGYIVVPPSNHVAGRNYAWSDGKSPAQIEVSPAPEWVVNFATQKKLEQVDNAGALLDGSRNNTLTKIAGGLKSRGLDKDAILAALLGINKVSCKPPLAESEVAAIANSISKYENQTVPLEWNSMKPLPDITLKAQSLCVHLIPRSVRDWIMDATERMQVTLDYIMPMVIVAASSVIGRQIAIRPKRNDSFEVVPNLWGMLIAPPSTLKSPAISEALSPLQRLNRLATEENIAAMTSAERDIYRVETEIKSLEKRIGRKGEDRESIVEQILELKAQLKELLPKARRYYSNDSTIEKLAMLLAENPNGLLVIRDELMGFFKTFEKSGHESDRSFFLEGWNGNGHFQVDRISRETISVHGLCLSVIGGIQPSRIKQYIGDVTSATQGDDGFIQRFQIMIYAEPRKSWSLVDRRPLKSAKDEVNNIFEIIANLDLLDIDAFMDGDHSLPYLRFDDEAQNLYNEWITALENRLLKTGDETEAMLTHLGKFRSLMPSLALIFHLLQYGQHRMAGNLVPGWAARLAIRWCDYLESHARKVYGLLGELQLDAAKALLKKVVDGKIRDGDSLRDIYRHHWSHLDSPKKVESAISILKDLGWCQAQLTMTGGAPSEVIRLNPIWIDELKKVSAKTAKSNETTSSGSSGTSPREQTQ